MFFKILLCTLPVDNSFLDEVHITKVLNISSLFLTCISLIFKNPVLFFLIEDSFMGEKCTIFP